MRNNCDRQRQDTLGIKSVEICILCVLRDDCHACRLFVWLFVYLLFFFDMIFTVVVCVSIIFFFCRVFCFSFSFQFISSAKRARL